LDVREHVDRQVTVALDQTEHRWLFLRQRASTTRTFQPATTTLSAPLPHDFRGSLMPRHDVDFVTFHHAVQADRLVFAMTPSRIGWSSPGHPSRARLIQPQAAGSTGPGPSGTRTRPRPSMADDDLQRWCPSDRRTAACTLGTHRVVGPPVTCETRVWSRLPRHTPDMHAFQPPQLTNHLEALGVINEILNGDHRRYTHLERISAGGMPVIR
jgi:hypothetical protein